MSLFSRAPDYSGLLRDISNIEFSNENIDNKTSAEKLAFMRKLKEKIEQSGILKLEKDNPAHILIRTVYNMLYTRQGSFPQSYYATLSEATSAAKGYIDTVHPYEQFLALQIESLRSLADAASRNIPQNRFSSALNRKAGLLKIAVMAILIGISAVGCKVEYKEVIPIHSVTSDGIEIEYDIEPKYMESYVIKTWSTIKDSELGTLVALEGGVFTRKDGSKENGGISLYSFNGETMFDIVVIRRDNGSIVQFMINKNSKSYKLIKERFGKRLKLYPLQTKLNWGR